MVACPVAVGGLIWSLIRLARVTGRQSRRPYALGGLAALPCFIAAAAWVVGSQHAPDATYRAGTLDLVLIAVMAAAARAAHRVRAAAG